MLSVLPTSPSRRTGSSSFVKKTVFQLLLLVVTLLPAATARRTRGYFKLSGANTEKVMTSFAIGTKGGRATVRVGMDREYDNDKHLKFHVFRDTKWKQYTKATLCSERIKLADASYDLSFVFKGEGPYTPQGGKWQAVRTVMIGDITTSDRLTEPHYFYFVLTDCSLEIYGHDGSVPKMYYEINTWNYYGPIDKKRTTQLGTNEDYLIESHEISIIISIAMLAWLIVTGIWRLARKNAQNTVHAAVIWIIVSVVLALASSILELIHLEIYHYNGAGNYTLDCLATHTEALSDASVILFLMSLAAGWTLPSDVISTAGVASGGIMTVQGMQAQVSNSLGQMSKLSRLGVVGGSFCLFQMILAQWGRTYNDDFDSYHDYAHLPGKIIMTLRVVLGLVFVGTIVQTKNQCRVNQLQLFYTIITGLGFLWFVAMPIVTFVCNWMLPLHYRHPVVFIASTIAQMCCLLFLSWLVTSHATPYHQYSHMSNNEGPSLGDSLLGSSPKDALTREWKLFGNAKMRLD